MGEIQRYSDQHSRDTSPISTVNTLPAKYVVLLFNTVFKHAHA